jgi:hypothetical protein
VLMSAVRETAPRPKHTRHFKMQVLTEKKSSVRRSTALRRLDGDTPQGSVEILAEGQECPFCHFAKLKREGREIFCPVCGYGRSACT